MQGLRDINFGNTERMSSVWSYISGRPIQVIPRDDGSFDVEVSGQLYKQGMSRGEISEEFLLNLDEEYRDNVTAAQQGQASQLFESELELRKELAKIQAQGEVDLAKIARERGLKVQSTGDGSGMLSITTPNGEVYLLDPSNPSNTGGLETTFSLVRVYGGGGGSNNASYRNAALNATGGK
jgi:hypothetical protein